MTIDSSQAFESAKKYVQYITDSSPIERDCKLVVDPEFEENDEYFAFYYNTEQYFITEDFRDGILGNAPILVSKASGEIRTVGTYLPWEKILREEPDEA